MSTFVFARNGMGDYTTGTGMREDMLMQAFNIFNYQAGVVLSGDLLVTERAAGANMSVDVAPGRCFIANSSYVVNTANSTRFWGMLNDAVVNLPISTNTSGSTRYDLIIGKIDTVPLANAYATNVGSVEVVEGIPGSGQPATPSNSELFGVLEIPDGTTTQIVDADITDSRVACGSRDAMGLTAYVPNLIYNYIEVYANQIYGDYANTEEFRIVKIIVPAGYNSGANLPAAIAAANALTLCDVELLPGSHYLTETLDLSGVSNIQIYGHGYGTEIVAIESGFSGTEVIYIEDSERLSLRNLTVGVSTQAGSVRAIALDGSPGVNRLHLDIWSKGGDTGDVVIYKTTTQIAKYCDITLRQGSNARPFTINGMKGSIIKVIGDDTITSGWTLGSATSQNIVQVTTDTAGTDTGTGNLITQTVY